MGNGPFGGETTAPPAGGINYDPGLIPTVEEEDETRRILRQYLAPYGIDIPMTMDELYQTVLQLQQMERILSWADQIPEFGPLATAKRMILDSFGPQYQRMQQSLMGYASDKWGETASTVTAILRPPVPSVEQLPTAEEYASNFDNAYSAFVEEMKGTVGPLGADWLAGNRAEAMRGYTAAMMNYAKMGASPFYLKEIDRLEQPAAGPGSAAAKEALSRALGKGVEDVTEITGAGAEVSAEAGRIGAGVPREFVALPRVSPEEWLRQTYPTERVKLLAAAPGAETARIRREAYGGMVGRPRRLRG